MRLNVNIFQQFNDSQKISNEKVVVEELLMQALSHPCKKNNVLLLNAHHVQKKLAARNYSLYWDDNDEMAFMLSTF